MTRRTSKRRTSKRRTPSRNPEDSKPTVNDVTRRIGTAHRAFEEAEVLIGKQQYEKAIEHFRHGCSTAGYAGGLLRSIDEEDTSPKEVSRELYGNLSDREEHVADLLVIALGQTPSPSDRKYWR